MTGLLRGVFKAAAPIITRDMLVHIAPGALVLGSAGFISPTLVISWLLSVFVAHYEALAKGGTDHGAHTPLGHNEVVWAWLISLLAMAKTCLYWLVILVPFFVRPEWATSLFLVLATVAPLAFGPVQVLGAYALRYCFMPM